MKKKLLFILTLLLCLTTGAWAASTVNDLATISSNYTFTASDYSNGGLTSGTLYDSNRIISLGGNGYNKGLQIKSNRQIAFKVSGSCTATFVFTEKSDGSTPRKLQIGSSSVGTDYGNSGTSPLECNITAAGVVYVSASSDLYLTSFTLEFASGPAKAYTVTAASNNSNYGTATAAAASLDEGETTEITATPKTGYEFTSWTVEGTGASLSSTTTNPTTLTMGTADATVTATFSAINYAITHNDATGGTYTISVAGGEAVSTNTTANYGQTITLAGTPTDPAHTTIAWNVKDASNNDVAVTNDQFTMPASAVTISPVFSEPVTLNTLFSMTDITGPTEEMSKGDIKEVTATFSDGGSAELYQNASSAASMLYTNNNKTYITLSGSSSSYLHVTFTTKLQAGDIITLPKTDSGKNQTYKISATSSNAKSKTFPYTISADDTDLIGATDLYVFKDGQNQFEIMTIEGVGIASDLKVTSSKTPVVAVGETSNIEVTTSGTGDVTYSSSDASVVTVSSTGVITGVSGGVATITVSQVADDTHRAGLTKIVVTVPETAIIKLKLKNTVTGTIGGSCDVNTQNRSEQDGGCKLGSKGHYVGITLAAGNTFMTGDVVELKIGTAGNGKIIFYDSKEQTNVLLDTDETPYAGTYRFVLPEAANGQASLYLVRGDTKNSDFNPYIDYVAVYRPNAILSLNAYGYATYSAATNFTAVGATAYKMALNIEAGTLAGTEVEKVPAGEGVLLKGEAGASVSILETSGVTTLEGNDLHGTTQADGTLASFDSNKTYYVLSGDTFKKYTGTTFAANKAFFQADGEGARSFTMTFDNGETTGISATLTNNETMNNEFFDLQGRRVAKPTKGLYIVNGKKVIMK